MGSFKLDGSVAGDLAPAAREQVQPMRQVCVGNGDGGTTLINKLVVSFGPISESAQSSLDTTQHNQTGNEGADAGSSEGADAGSSEGADAGSPEGADAGHEGAVGKEGAVEDEADKAGSEGAVGGGSEDVCDTNTSDSDIVDKETDCRLRYKRCVVCEKECLKRIKRCKLCHSGCYCSRSCREVDVGRHKELCNHIQELVKIEEKKKVLNAFSVREQNQVDVKLRDGLVKLVGEKPLLRCTVGTSQEDALWDTGAQVSMVGDCWLSEENPDAEVMTVQEFLKGDDLHLCAANNTNVDVAGVVILDVTVGGYVVPVPFLVTHDKLDSPILGYNLIKHLVKDNVDGLPLLLKESLPCLSSVSQAEAVIALIQTDLDREEEVRVVKKMVLPARSRCRVKCRTEFGTSQSRQNVLFTPYPVDSDLEVSDSVVQVKLGNRGVHVVVSNPTNHPITLERGVVLGSVESISAMIPVGPSSEVSSEVSDKDTSQSNVHVNSVSTDEGPPVDLSHVDLSHLSDEHKAMAEKLLREESGVFCLSKDDHGDCPDLQMELTLTDNIPVVVPHRQIPRPLYDEVKNFINDLIANNWVRESKSSYSSPIVCVRKKDQSLRLCIDYRALNRKIIPDKQPIPRIQEIFDGLHGQEWFSTLDMAKAYHQGYVAEDFRKYTAFSTPWGIYEWLRVPMGISNAPPAFQRFINQTLAGLRDKVCVAYLDDILVYGSSFEEHLENLRKVLRRLQSKGIKLRADKCSFFRAEVRYLGRLVSKNGHRPDPADTIALEKFRTPPSTIGDLRSLLGFFGYYRSYVPDFSRKFQPLYALLKTKDKDKDVAKGDEKARSKKKKTQCSDSKSTIEWTVEMQQVVNETVDYLRSPTFLVFPDFDKPFILNCDASEKGLGAVLYQKYDGKPRVVSFASRTLNEAEKKYHLHSGKLEFLCLKWAITEKFADYLGYAKFDVYTDNNPLTYVMSTAKLNATGLRWVAELSNFQFELHYRPGKNNGDADGLSRFPMDLSQGEGEYSKMLTLADLSSAMAVSLSSPPSLAFADVSLLQLCGVADLVEISREDLSTRQMEDAVVGPIYKCVAEGRRPSKEEKKSWCRKTQVMLHQFNNLSLENGLLVRTRKKRKQLVLPEYYHRLVLTELHNKMGHLGADKVEELARHRFYWAYMQDDIEFYIQNECACIADKRPVQAERAPLVPIASSAPFELICIDFLHLDRSKGGFNYVLMVTDHFTRFTQSYATKNNSAKTAAERLYQDFFPRFGFPVQIHSDMGREFKNSLFTELHRLAGVRMSNTTPYHPMGNGEVERMNRTLCNMLKALQESQKDRWKEHLPNLMFAYNSTANKTTGYSPFFLMFGRESRLPIDCVMPLSPETTARKTYDSFVKDWKNSMRDAFQIANQHIERAGAANKRRYDVKFKSAVSLVVGDRVLVRNLSERGGTGKLRSWWEHCIYRVTEASDSLPVFTIQPVGGGPSRTVHRNLLMRVNHLPVDTFGQKDVACKPRQQKRRVRRTRQNKSTDVLFTSALDSSSSGDDVVADIELCLRASGSSEPVTGGNYPSSSLVVNMGSEGSADGDSSSVGDVTSDDALAVYDSEVSSLDDESPAVTVVRGQGDSEELASDDPLVDVDVSSAVDESDILSHSHATVSDDVVDDLTNNELDLSGDVVSYSDQPGHEALSDSMGSVVVDESLGATSSPVMGEGVHEDTLIPDDILGDSSPDVTFLGFSDVSPNTSEVTLVGPVEEAGNTDSSEYTTADELVADDAEWGASCSPSGNNLNDNAADEVVSCADAGDGSLLDDDGVPLKRPDFVPSWRSRRGKYSVPPRRSSRTKTARNYLTYDANFRQTTKPNEKTAQMVLELEDRFASLKR